MPYCCGLLAPRVLGGDDGDALGRDADVTQDQRQDALADAAEADEDDACPETRRESCLLLMMYPCSTLDRKQRARGYQPSSGGATR